MYDDASLMMYDIKYHFFENRSEKLDKPTAEIQH
jgi:hypothetical protein